MKKKVLTIFLITLLLAACKSDSQSFKGEGDNWIAELNTTSDGQAKGFVLRYKGLDTQTVGLIDVDLNAGNFGYSVQDGEVNEKGIFMYDPEQKLNNMEMEVEKDNEIHVTIKWNDKTEEIKLNK